jgi:hypothetical protein
MSYNLSSNTMSSKILYIDSRDADNYLATKLRGDGITQVDLTSYFQYVLKENIEIPLNQRALISLNSATIPYSFYNIRLGINDILTATAKNTGSGATIGPLDFTIPPGNYTAYSLADIIINQINNGNLQDAGNNITFALSMVFNTDTQKYQYTITTTEANPISLTFNFQDKDLISPHIEMGFPANDFTFTSGQPTQNSQNVVDINGSIHGVYIRTNLVSTGTLDSQNGTFSNILSRIPINVQSGGIIFATPNNQTHRSIVDIRAINMLTIRLTDERNRILDLNGLHFQIAIAIDFIHAEKPVGREYGGLSEAGGGSYLVESDNTSGKKIEIARQNALLQEQVQMLERNRRRVGRPRNVGRPRGSTKNK